jgi:uncharacterized protein YukE
MKKFSKYAGRSEEAVSVKKDMKSLPERLRANCNGHPCAMIAWPHRILHEAADRIEELDRENVLLRKALEDAPKPAMAWSHISLTAFASNYEDWYKAAAPAHTQEKP